MASGKAMAMASLLVLEPTLSSAFLPLVEKDAKSALQLVYLIGVSHGTRMELSTEEANAFKEAISDLVIGKGKPDASP